MNTNIFSSESSCRTCKVITVGCDVASDVGDNYSRMQGICSEITSFFLQWHKTNVCFRGCLHRMDRRQSEIAYVKTPG
jgi:hypothetical protein